MYGTIARMRIKPGFEQQLTHLMHEYEDARIPGLISEYVYRMDSDPNEYYLTVLFDSRESYWANARDPEQAIRYQKLRDLLVEDPEWHDGEIAYSGVYPPIEVQSD